MGEEEVEGTGMLTIEEITRPLVGRHAWGVRQGVGSFITIEFGRPALPSRPGKWVHGEWHLWVMYCSWLVSEGSEFVAASEDTSERVVQGLQRMEGATVTCITVRGPTLDTTITFSGGVTLRLFPQVSEGYQHWMLFTPDGNVLVVGPGGRWLYRSKDEPLDRA